MKEEIYWVYILRCGDGTYYTGTAADVEARLSAHRAGKGAKYTRGRGPLEVVYRRELSGKSEALKEELRIKSLSRSEKEQLIAEKNKNS